jgi:hypothetical protein
MPEVLAEHHLPEVFDASGILANQKDSNIFQRTDDSARMPFERRLTPADEAGLIRLHFDEYPIAHPRIANHRFDCSNLHKF